ncbi:GGDEF domain-containing protein [Celerinatantimonas diazotrophica]|uniref:diguanylate cyclase n=1 Tax=Celerinatantimonas diazotrophica TaxID=412034 RepID=A0A4R1JAY6_9GAMM|nr:diguanylate cyclase [Celerinatantimonas diazotrophica]TCK47269.1 diguanylate cyclase (GGDEF)-like protein [Celerinatantimonas diazotrophica]CAG9296041.1 hypothetical protein CEDIAZO_01180 [Celerinatantimonas diazotrophica]
MSSDSELTTIVNTNDALQASYSLLYRLSIVCKGFDLALDNRLAELRQKIDHNAPPSHIHEAIENITKRLESSYRQNSQNAILKFQALANTATDKLQNINGLPPKIRQQLKEFISQSAPYSYQENIARLGAILEFYHQALTNKPGGIGQVVEQPESKAIPKHSLLDDKQHQRICDELQCIISELDFEKPTNDELNHIRNQLLDGVAPELIPSICQRVIQLMINGFREERKQTQEYLLSLNQDLEYMDKNFGQHVDLSKQLQQSYGVQNKTLKRQVLNMGVELKEVDDLEYAKELMQQRIIQMGSIFKQNEQLETQFQDLTIQLQNLNNQLDQLRQQSSEQQKKITSQKQQLFIDKLTQIYNRSALDERMELEFKRWRRYGYDLGLAIIDLDHFKAVNTQFGHLAGDKALKVIARALQSSLRDTDFLARFGGEEFVLLMPKINADDLHLPLDHLREHISSLPFRFKQQQISITATIGATLFRDNDRLLDAFERADQALYEAKNQGLNHTNVIL